MTEENMPLWNKLKAEETNEPRNGRDFASGSSV